MILGRQPLPATASKAQLEAALARHTIERSPSLYVGYEDDALKFVHNTIGKTRKSLLLAAQCLGLAVWS